MDRVRFITHQGKQILFIDVTNCAADEVIELLTEVQRIVTAQPPKSALTLSDLTGAQFSCAAITRMKEGAVFDRPYVKRAAIVGAQSLPRVYFEALKTLLPAGIPEVQDPGGSTITDFGGQVRVTFCRMADLLVSC